MKITDGTPITPPMLAGPRSGDPPARPGAPADAVAVSASSRTLARLLAYREDGPDGTDPARLEALRVAVAEGTYTIDPEAIARAMLRALAG